MLSELGLQGEAVAGNGLEIGLNALAAHLFGIDAIAAQHAELAIVHRNLIVFDLGAEGEQLEITCPAPLVTTRW